ncbi:helix-turn-helix domain-containing protein [Devosia sp. A8/3-2]|nr:helix-turn-helix domain-containing protein [Devosia sp. A8/3-2]
MNTHVAAERSAWQLQVVGDHRVKLVALRVAVIIGQHVNAETHDARPSQDYIASLIGCHRGNVAHAIAALVRLGHLEIEKDGRGNRYRLAMRVSGNAGEAPTKRVPPNADQASTCFPGNAHLSEAMRVPGDAPSAFPETCNPRSGARANRDYQGMISEGAAPSGASAPITEPLGDHESLDIAKGMAGAP